MAITLAPRTWVLFLCSADDRPLPWPAAAGSVHLNRYRIQTIVPVRGDLPTALRPGWSVARVEGPTPASATAPPMAPASPVVEFHGVTHEVHYTTAEQRRALDARMRPEAEPSPSTTAVLIPVAKSAAWWQLAQDERQAFFHHTDAGEGHTAIGLRYVDRVYRKLYHSRDLPAATTYHFLTYFEFQDGDAPAFRELLAELRDDARNPEWRYVDREFEIWMTKLA